MPKFNMYQSLHTTMIGPEGRPLEIQIRTQDMHEMAEFGVAAHWMYKQPPPPRGNGKVGPAGEEKIKWLRSMLDWQKEMSDPQEFMESLKHRPVRGRGVRVHAQGRGEVACGGRHAARLRLRGAHRDRPPLRGSARERQDRAAALRAALWRHRGDPHRQARARTLARLVGDGEDDQGAQQDQAVVQGGVARGHRAHRTRAAAGAPQEAGPARAEDHGLGAARGRDPRDGVSQSGRLLHRAGRGEDLAEGGGQQSPSAPQAGRGRRRRSSADGPHEGGPPAPASDELLGPVRDQGAGRGRRDVALGQVLPSRARRSDPRLHLARGGGSRSTARTARTRGCCSATPNASRA